MRRFALFLSFFLLLTGCQKAEMQRQKTSLFVGVDVSGSFYSSGHFEDALDFLSYYLWGHLNGAADLKAIKVLFVGSIGGDMEDETKAFHPVQDFEEKSLEEIRANLKKWFVKSDNLTDFNVFFKQVALIAQKRSLSLSPITIVLLTDGLPDVPGISQATYESIDVSPLEYVSRNTTVRLLYASPVAAHKWETLIPRKRVRMWTVDDQVMPGWREKLKPTLPLLQQDKLWTWVADNVDFRVKPTRFQLGKKEKSE